MVEKNNDNSKLKKAYIASGIALASIGATAANADNAQADTTATTQPTINNNVIDNTNQQQATSAQGTNTYKSITVQPNESTNTNYNYGGNITNDVSSTSSAPAKNATNVSGANNAMAAGTSGSITYNPQLASAPANVTNFVNAISKDAVRVANEYGVYASMMIAQAGLESAWGQSTLATKGHNLFGVKYRGTGNYVTMPTQEYYNGSFHWINDKFQKYDSYYGSLVGYAQLIQKNYPNSTKAKASSYQQAAQNLRHGVYGTYATDPGYASKLTNLIQSYGFAAYDKATTNSAVKEKYENGAWYLYNGNKKMTGLQYLSTGNKVVYYTNDGKMVHGQKNINGKWYYFDDSTGAMQTGFKYIANQKKNVYYNAQGQMLYGQQKINGQWYLFDNNNGAMKYGWQKIANQNKTVYYTEKGQMVHGQKYINGHWYYFDDNTGAELVSTFKWIPSQNKTVYYNNQGQMLYGTHLINGKVYSFDKYTGAMRANTFFYNNETKGTQYYNSKGQLVFGQQRIGNFWYAFDKNTGNLLTGFQNLKDYGQDKVVYYNSKGQMLYGQQYINGHWYLFDKSTGARKYGFQRIIDQNKTVYYNNEGQMLYGLQKLNGKLYYFNKSNGAMTTGWSYVENDGKLHYFDKDGKSVTGTVKIGNNTYQFNLNGDLITSEDRHQFRSSDGKWFLLENGKVLTGWQTIKEQNKTVYYDKNTGKMLYGQQYIDGHWYLFDNATGAMKTGWQTIKNQNKTVYYNKQGQMVYGKQVIDGKTYNFNTSTGAVNKF